MKKVYFAAPLFNEAEKAFNVQLAAVLEEAGYEVFLPQRDGFEAAMLFDLTQAQKSKMIFDLDIGALEKADVLFMVLDGRIPDEGACVELGYAFAKGKPCYAIKTDVRAAELDLELNPMLAECFRTILSCPDRPAAEALAHFLQETNL